MFLKEINSFIFYLKKFLMKVISLEDKLYTFRIFVEFYLLMKITSYLNDKIILSLIVNILIFYAPLEKKNPHFLFKTRMIFKQIIEGIIILILCLVPKYEEEKEENKEKIE